MHCVFHDDNVASSVLEAVNKLAAMVNEPLPALITSAIRIERWPRPPCLGSTRRLREHRQQVTQMTPAAFSRSNASALRFNAP